MDNSLIFQANAYNSSLPGTHVLLIGVGYYAYGKGAGASFVGEDLCQLTSPPISARAMADWFLTSFKNDKKPLISVSLLISEKLPIPYRPPQPLGAKPATPQAATLANVRNATRHWADRVGTHPDNLAVFYFCGHGVSLGQSAALLLEDFGEPGAEFDGAIDLGILRGTMKNSRAIQQAYLLDCCRTKADNLYQNEASIGSRVVSVDRNLRGHTIPSQHFVLFPTIDGEGAFGIPNSVSAFTSSMIDAMSFAAADFDTGVWRTTTGKLIDAVDRIVSYRVPRGLANRSKPNALDATSFDFNVIDEPKMVRSFVTISNLTYWKQVELECQDANNAQKSLKKHSADTENETCCTFNLDEGRWWFRGELASTPPKIKELERSLRVPVAHVELEVIQ